jgi:sterol desaturase/sphingolipid hydroxylase (fatty acid hydroxylase superfamily)
MHSGQECVHAHVALPLLRARIASTVANSTTVHQAHHCLQICTTFGAFGTQLSEAVG